MLADKLMTKLKTKKCSTCRVDKPLEDFCNTAVVLLGEIAIVENVRVQNIRYGLKKTLLNLVSVLINGD